MKHAILRYMILIPARRVSSIHFSENIMLHSRNSDIEITIDNMRTVIILILS